MKPPRSEPTPHRPRPAEETHHGRIVLSHLAWTHALIVAFAFVGAVMWFSISYPEDDAGRVHGSAIAILIGLALAYAAGLSTGGQKGVVDWPWLAGIGLLGGAMLRDFAIVATAFEVDVVEAKKAGMLGVIALAIGTVVPFVIGAVVALAFGYDDAISMATIGAGADHLHRRSGDRRGARCKLPGIALSIATGCSRRCW